VHDDHAELTADYKIHLESADWVSVPLVHNGAALQEPASFHGDAEHEVEHDATTGSYSVRLRGAGKEQQITTKFVVPVKTLGAQQRLDIDLPAAVASRFTLQVPQSHVELVSHTGCTLAEVKAQPIDTAKGNASKGSEITLWGVTGPVSLVWQEQTAANATPVLEATGQVFAQIDSRSVQFDALLTVRGFGAQFDKFRVKLPPGAQLSGGAPAGANYTLTVIGTDHANTESQASGGTRSDNPKQTAASELAAGQWVEIRLAQPTSEPVDVHLQAERAYDLTRPNQSLELAGFEIQEAAPHRQWGHIAVAVVGDWQLGWGDRNRVRQIAELPEGLQRKGVVAGFEYYGQPASLTARVMPR
jgi:hypothetical protein